MSTLLEPPVAIEPVKAVPKRVADRPLPVLCVESAGWQWGWFFVAALAIAFYGYKTISYAAPADGGVDQNAYLMGGRMIAEHFSPRFTLPNPYAYVGGMFIRTSPLEVSGGDYFPKYPFGLPLIYASFFWILGPTKAAVSAFWVSPSASIIAVTGMFFLARKIAGSFAGLMAAVLLASSQLMIELSNNANSHETCVAFVIWGMYALIQWWQRGWMWVGILAGFLLGYAALVRYSEGLLVLPIAIACASRLRWTDWKSYLRCAAPGLAWAVPVGTLLIFNKHTMGNWTGYDSTNESEGFTWLKFTQTWEQMIRTYYDMGAFFILPIGIAGLLMVFGRSWKLGLMLLAWLLPGTALYTSYYWSPDRGVAYARFILTFLPAVMLGAAICFSDGIMNGPPGWRRLPRAIAVLGVVGIAASLGIYRSVHGLQQGTGGALRPLADDLRARRSLANTGKELLDHVPVNSVLFADNGVGSGLAGNEKPLNYIQFLRHWDVYALDAFDFGGPRGAGNVGRPNGNFFANLAGNAGNPNDPLNDPNAVVPTTRQPLQAAYVHSLYYQTQNGREIEKPSFDLRKAETAMLDAAYKANHHVFAMLPIAKDHDVRRAFTALGKYTIAVTDTWKDLPALPPDPVLADAGNTMGGRRGRNNFGNMGGGRRGGNNAGMNAEAPPTDWELLEIKPGG